MTLSLQLEHAQNIGMLPVPEKPLVWKSTFHSLPWFQISSMRLILAIQAEVPPN